jgi:methyl-accepting chemotaxis protein
MNKRQHSNQGTNAFAKAADVLPIAVVAVDGKGRVTCWNTALEALSGVSADEMLGKKSRIGLGEGNSRTPIDLALRFEEEEVEEAFVITHRKDGETKVVRFVARPLYDDSGEDAVGAVATLTEVAGARAVASSGGTSVLDDLPSLVIAVDPNYTLTYVNHAAANAVEKTAEECIGRKCFEVLSTDNCRSEDCAVSCAMQSGQSAVRTNCHHLAKRSIPTRCLGSVVRDDEDNVVGALEWAVDITEENQAVAEVSGLADALRAGCLDVRGDPDMYATEGFRDLIGGINGALDAITSPVEEVARALGALAAGDLTTRIEAEFVGDHGRLKKALNATAATLQNALSQIAGAAAKMTGASEQIASSSLSVAEGASRQAAALVDTSGSMEEMAAMTRRNAEHTRQAQALAVDARQAADGGREAVEQMTGSMTRIRQAAAGTAEIIRDINEIAFQTNLLALNAAVEAARAGDAGRGFAVVAEEVRNLAQRSKQAAMKTEELIRESVQQAEQGQTVAASVDESLNQIAASVAKVTELVTDIAGASEDQARGIEQVNRAVAEMDGVIQSTAASAEESAASAQELFGKAHELSSMMARLGIGQDALVPNGEDLAGQGDLSASPRPGSDGTGSLEPNSVIPLDDAVAAEGF